MITPLWRLFEEFGSRGDIEVWPIIVEYLECDYLNQNHPELSNCIRQLRINVGNLNVLMDIVLKLGMPEERKMASKLKRRWKKAFNCGHNRLRKILSRPGVPTEYPLKF